FGSGRADLVFLRAERGEIDVEGLPTELAAWLRSALRSVPEERPSAEELLGRLAELDLTVYDDPGETEVLSTARGGEQHTAVLPTAHAAGGEQGRPEATAAHTPAEAPTASPTSHSMTAQEPRTELLPALGGASEQPTETLPRITTPDEPVT